MDDKKEGLIRDCRLGQKVIIDTVNDGTWSGGVDSLDASTIVLFDAKRILDTKHLNSPSTKPLSTVTFYESNDFHTRSSIGDYEETKITITYAPDAKLRDSSTLKHVQEEKKMSIDDYMIGEEVLVNTENCGTWFGTLSTKKGREIVLNNARRVFSVAQKRTNFKEYEALCGDVYESTWVVACTMYTCNKELADSIKVAKIQLS